MFPSYMLQGGGSSSLLQGGGSTGGSVQGSTANPQQTISIGQLQPAANIPLTQTSAPAPQAGPSLGATTAVDPAAQAAAAAAAKAAAEEAARQAKLQGLRGDVTNIANHIKDIFNQRYSLVDQSAAEQSGKLNDRFGTESHDITQQVEGENQKLGAAHAAAGSYDSSYRGNNVDTVTHAGENQIRDLGTELQDNLGKVGAYATSQKAGFDAEKSGMDAILSHLNESDSVDELTRLRNTLDGRISQLQGGQADYNTNAQNRSALEQIAPSSQRAQQLKTTLSQVVAGNADANQKLAIGSRLIQSAGLSPEDQQSLLTAFNGDIQNKDQQTA